jgi:reactive intermediate/imine deaminase
MPARRALRVSLTIVACVALASWDRSLAADPVDSPRYYTAPRARPLPFSDAVRAGNLLFVSGQLGVDAELKLVPGGIEAETRAVMDHIRRIVEANGSSMDRIVKCTCMLADMDEWPKMNEVYVTYFPKDRLPARGAFGAGGLALGARVEIECIAAIGD